MAVETIARRDADLTAAERELIAAWQVDAFGAQTWTRGYTWAPPEWRLLLVADGRPVSHLKVVTRTGTVDGAPVRLGGVGSVMTPTPLRGRGYASQLMRSAADFLFDEIGAEMGMLFCLPHLVPLYQAVGWTEVRSPVWIGQPAGRVRWPESAMVLPPPGVAWRDRQIDVCGLPW